MRVLRIDNQGIKVFIYLLEHRHLRPRHIDIYRGFDNQRLKIVYFRTKCTQHDAG